MGRPARGARYSSSSTPGPAAARSVVIRSRAPSTLFSLLRTEVLALSHHLESQHIPIVTQARRRIAHHDRRVVDTEEEAARGGLPLGVPLPTGHQRTRESARQTP